MNTQTVMDFFKRNEKASYIAAIIVLLFIAFYFMGGQGVQAPETGDENNNTATSTATGTDMISVATQPAGLSVVLEKIALTEKSWVVIHADKDGAPGQILGAGRFYPENATGTVELVTKGTEAGQTYYAMVHTDDGDDEFSYKTDLPKLVDGEEVMVSFQVTATSTAQ